MQVGTQCSRHTPCAVAFVAGTVIVAAHRVCLLLWRTHRRPSDSINISTKKLGEHTMADISAADVKALREATGTPMMECKQALVEASGDFEKAKGILRERNKKVQETRL